MAIKIKLINCSQDPTKQSPEGSAACLLEERFKQEFEKYPEAKGTLYVLRSISIFGYEVRDIDLVLIGKFESFCYRNKVLTKNYDEVQGLYIDGFICNVELKDITLLKDSSGKDRFAKIGTSYIYTYKNSGEKNITEQAFKQKNSFRQYMKDNLNIEPWMTDHIWFRSLNPGQLSEVRHGEKDNAFDSELDFYEFIKGLLLQTNVERHIDGTFHLNGFSATDSEVAALSKFLCEKRVAKGLTKKKFELLSQEGLDINKIKAGVGDQLTVLSGRAGTGKTIQLLQLAFHLANTTNNKRCLFLTYNNALVCDIRRLIDFSNIPVSMDERTVSIQTIDSFFIQLLELYGVVRHNSLIPSSKDYLSRYNDALGVLYETILKDLDDNEIEAIKDMVDCHIDWDFILIDEAQDWTNLQKQLLLKLYGPKRIVVADGIDQFIMSCSKQNWSVGIKANKHKEMDLELRQKANIVEFVNAFSRELRLGWSIRRNEKLTGGQIDVYKDYDSNIHKELRDHCIENGCENYDILILTPPNKVETDENGASHFILAEAYAKANIKIFDGTNSSNRHRYPTKDLTRVYQYDSCRGLEGWAVVCLNFDELINYKLDTIDEKDIRDLYSGLDLEEGKKKFVYTWALMPLTRPVDRLVITLKDPKSEIGVILKNLSNQFEDFMTWHID